MVACFCKVLNSFLSFAVPHELKKTSFVLSQKVAENSFVSLLFPGDSFFCKLVKDVYKSFSNSSLSHSLISIMFNFGSWTSRKALIWEGGFEWPLFKKRIVKSSYVITSLPMYEFTSFVPFTPASGACLPQY